MLISYNTKLYKQIFFAKICVLFGIMQNMVVYFLLNLAKAKKELQNIAYIQMINDFRICDLRLKKFLHRNATPFIHNKCKLLDIKSKTQ